MTTTRKVGDRIVTAYGRNAAEELGTVATNPDNGGWYDVDMDGGYRLYLNDERAELLADHLPRCSTCRNAGHA